PNRSSPVRYLSPDFSTSVEKWPRFQWTMDGNAGSAPLSRRTARSARPLVSATARSCAMLNPPLGACVARNRSTTAGLRFIAAASSHNASAPHCALAEFWAATETLLTTGVVEGALMSWIALASSGLADQSPIGRRAAAALSERAEGPTG